MSFRPHTWFVASHLLYLWVFLSPFSSHAGPTYVGNGNDGSDLEGLSLVTEGPLVESRKKAVELLKKLNVSGVAGLGSLLPEVEHSEIFLSKRDANASLPEDQGAFHTDMKGQVFARTFAQPHASTRFFPSAVKLGETEQIALHIHEGLHRALPPGSRENEAVVSALTLSITSPDPTHDRVAAASMRHLPNVQIPQTNGSQPQVIVVTQAQGQSAVSEADTTPPTPETALVNHPSLVGYSFRRYAAPKGAALFPVNGMHSIKSFLYPFGNNRLPLGLGIEASLVQTPTQTHMGPLELSARLRLWSGRGFDVGAWATGSLNTLSAEELKNSPVGRDVGTLGLSMRKDFSIFYVENFLSYSFPGDSKTKIGPYEYSYQYGGVVQVSMHTGVRLWKFTVGGLAELGLADYFRVNGPGFTGYDTGRYRYVSAGPEIAFQMTHFKVDLAGKWMLDASRDVNYDALGNLMGQGVGQGSVNLGLSVLF